MSDVKGRQPHDAAGRQRRSSIGGTPWAAVALAAPLLVAAAVAPAASRRDALAALEDEPSIPRHQATMLSLDYDAKPGVTIVGLTASAPLRNHTVYETGDATLVVDVPDVDVAGLQPVAQVGSRELESVTVDAPGTAGLRGVARFTFKKAADARREVAIDPKNPNRLEIRLVSAASPAGDSVPAKVAPAKVLASAPAAPPAPPRATADPPAGVPDVVPVAPPVREVRSEPAAAPREALEVAEASSRGTSRLTDAAVQHLADGRVILKLTGSGALDGTPFLLENPPRLGIDLPNTVESVRTSTLPVRDAGILRVRVAQHQPLPDPVTRVVVDLERQVDYQVERGPGSLAIILGRPLAATVASAAPVTAAAPAVPVPTSHFAAPDPAQLGRPSTFAGTVAPPSRPMRETANPAVVAPATTASVSTFQTVEVSSAGPSYTGEPISVNLKGADLEDLFRLFAEYANLNVVLDNAVKGKTITLVLDEVPWDQALALVLKTNQLGSTLDGNVLRIAPLAKLAQEEQQKKAFQEAKDLSGDLVQVARVLSYAQAGEVDSLIRKTLSSRGQTTVDRRTNMLIVKDLKQRIDEVDKLIDLIDAPTRQVMIETRIVETTKDFSKSWGLNWGFNYLADRSTGNSTGFAFPRSVGSDFAVNLPAVGQNTSLGLSFRNILNTFALDLAIEAQEDRGRARVISRPMVVVQNNEQASIESGVQIPISTTTATEVDVTFVSASLRLQVRPQITADDTVIMDLRVENNSPIQIAGSDQASIATRQAQTVVAVPNGGTTIIGGIYQVNESVNQSRTPLLSRLPLIGWLFRNKNISRTNDELLIFVTPKIQKS